jgi:hypothetical protein
LFAEKYKEEKPIIMDDFQQFFDVEELSPDLKSFVAEAEKSNVVLLLLATHGQTLGRRT